MASNYDLFDYHLKMTLDTINSTTMIDINNLEKNSLAPSKFLTFSEISYNITLFSTIASKLPESTLTSISDSQHNYNNKEQHQLHRNYTSLSTSSLLYEELTTWHGICLIIVFCAFIITTTIGNTLVILAVITTRRLRTVTNCFVMSLAVADLLVGIFVMPPAVAVHLVGSWQLGWILCDIWISLDVLLCTASILSLCAISIDRYLAVTRPLTYSRKRRSKRLALIMILIVWILALAITCPPILGWYEPGRRDDLMECRYNQNEGYVIFSAMGSFFIPMAVMIYVYARISCVVSSRHDKMVDIGIHNKKFKRYQDETEVEQECSELDSSGMNNKKSVTGRSLSNQTIIRDLQDAILEDEIGISNLKNSSYELVPANSRTSSFKRIPSVKMKYSSSVIVNVGGNGNSGTILSTTGTNNVAQQTENQWPSSVGMMNRHHSVRCHHSQNTATAYHHQPPQQFNRYSTRSMRVHQKSVKNRITSIKRENKTTQTLSIVVGGFIACWLPFFIYYLITPFLAEETVSEPLAKFLTWLGWFNSAINPFIYAFYSVDFRSAFWRLTFKRFMRSPQKAQFPNNTLSIRR